VNTFDLDLDFDLIVVLQTYLGTQLTVFSYSSSDAFKAVAQVVGQEVEAKYKVISQEIKEETDLLSKQLQVKLARKWMIMEFGTFNHQSLYC
jgi:D-ribose pyranose/furanose isomerase RbsD